MLRRAHRRTLPNRHRFTLHFEQLEGRKVLATLTVNVADDFELVNGAGNDNRQLTLREAVAYVNNPTLAGPLDRQQIDETADPLGVNDRIVFANGVNDEVNLFSAGPATIALEHGTLWVQRSVTIEGPGWDLLTLDGAGQAEGPAGPGFVGDGAGVLLVQRTSLAPISSFALSGMTITGGDRVVGGGISAVASAGENFAFRSLRVVGNSALNRGGGVELAASDTGSILFENSLVENNRLSPLGTGLRPNPLDDLPNQGAGIAANASSGGTIEIDRTSATGNVSTYVNSYGGGLGIGGVGGTIRVTDSLFAQNVVGSLLPADDFFNLTLGQNLFGRFDQPDATVGLGGDGGGIGIKTGSTAPTNPSFAEGTLEFVGVSLVGNTAYGGGGGFYHDLFDFEPNFDLTNALIYDNQATFGGGVFGSNGAIRHSTIASNRAGHGGTTGTDVYGSGVALAWMNYIGVVGNFDTFGNDPDLPRNEIGVSLDHTIVYDNLLNAAPATETFPDFGFGAITLQLTFLWGDEIGLENEGWVYSDPRTGNVSNGSASIPGGYSIIGSITNPERTMVRDTSPFGFVFTLTPPANSSSSDPALASSLSYDSAIEFLDGSFLPVLPLLSGSAAIDAGSFSRPVYPVAAGQPLVTDLRGPGFDRITGPLIDIGSYEFGSGTAITPPRVEDVVFIGANVQQVRMDPLVAASRQMNSLGLSNYNQVRIEFDRPIDNFQAGDLTLRALAGGPGATQLTATQVTPDADGRAATWTLSGNLPVNVFALRVDERLASGGAPLDGEWVNANRNNQASGSPMLRSGDGVAGGDFVFTFVNFPGDFSGDYSIDLLDLDILGANFGSGSTHATGDANGDGVVDLLDLDIFGANFRDTVASTLNYTTLRDLLAAANYTGGSTGDLVDGADEQLFVAGGGIDRDLDNDGDSFDMVDQAIFEWYRDIEVM